MCIGTLMTDQFNSISIGRKVSGIGLSQWSSPVFLNFKTQAGSPVNQEQIFLLLGLDYCTVVLLQLNYRNKSEITQHS